MLEAENKKLMDTNSAKLAWHYETLPPKTKKALDFLSGEKWLEKSEWYLAGGTALSLQTGNRKSYDLDFFTIKKSFDTKKLISRFIDNQNWITDIEEKNTVYGQLFGAKVSFIAYPFFAPDENFLKHGFIKILDKKDIAVMKITAVSQRGRKRDFFDLYWCAKNVEPLEDIIKKLPKQYPIIAHDYHHILKAILFFEDAESDPEPEIYFDANWKAVKDFFTREISLIADKLIR